LVLEALEAGVVGLKKVVRLRWLLVVAGWVRGCARIRDGHEDHPFVVRAPGGGNLAGAVFCLRPHFSILLVFCKSFGGIIGDAE
jgi:hypothetical protein